MHDILNILKMVFVFMLSAGFVALSSDLSNEKMNLQQI